MNVIEMHTSWLAINSVIGCPNGCKYCLLQSNSNNKTKPKELVTPKEAVEQLLKSKYYDPKIPVCLLPSTDAFVTPSNIEYLLDLINEIEKRNVPNDLIIITKCEITDDVIEKAKKIKEKGQNIVFYISYSGLGLDIEPAISEEVLKNNFRKLKDNDLDVIHYYRPLMPQNSSTEKIEEILNFVSQYTDISVTTGLALIKSFIDKIDCWEEAISDKNSSLKANCVWPEEAWEYFGDDYSHSQQTFQTNTCALNTKLNRTSPQYYGTYDCEHYNHCSSQQRLKCAKEKENIKLDTIVHQLYQYLEKLNINIDDLKYYFDEDGIVLENVDLTLSDLSYLSFMLNIKVHLTNADPFDNVYNSSLNGAKPLVIKKVRK